MLKLQTRRRVLDMAGPATEPDENLDWLDTRRQSRSGALNGTRLAPRVRAGHGKGIFSRVSLVRIQAGSPGNVHFQVAHPPLSLYSRT